MPVLVMWILYVVFAVAIFSLIFFWAIRTRQFGDQDRARYLPLERPKQDSEEKEEEPPPDDEEDDDAGV